MKKIFFYGPYIPVLGILIVVFSMIKHDLKICLFDENERMGIDELHFYGSGISQSISILLLILLFHI